MNKETLEEAAEKYGKQVLSDRKDKNLTLDEEIWLRGGSIVGFIAGAKWQAERMYSEAEVLKIVHDYRNHFELYRNIQVLPDMFFGWFEQFKKK